MPETLKTFGGTPFELGEAYGRAFEIEIAWLIDWYQNRWWEMSDEEVLAAIPGFERAIELHAPDLHVEIEGIAHGAGQPVERILALNARTELRADVHVLECTSVGVHAEHSETGGALLAQNWDWWNQLRGRSACVRFEPDGKAPMISLLEPGMVGKIGMNASGFGVCLNFLATPEVNPEGLPVHILCRLLAECSSVEQAIALLESVPRAANANYLVGDRTGAAATIEAMVDAVHITYAEDTITHTNVALCEGDWCMRQSIFERRLGMFARPLGVDHLQTALRHPGVSAPPSDEPAVESLRSVVMDLKSGAFAVSEGCRAGLSGYTMHPV